MANVRSEMIFANVSASVSAGDGLPYDVVNAQPPALLVANNLVSTLPNGTTGVSAPMMTWLELIRRTVTHIDTASVTVVAATSGNAVAVTVGTQTGSGGIAGKIQGVPFYISGVGHLSAQLASSVSTTSNQIRKVLVCLALSALPVQSSMASGAGSLQCTVGSAYLTSAGAVVSGGAASYFDLVPLPQASAGEVPVGWLNVPNTFSASASVSATMLWSDYRALQGINLSAMMTGLTQP